MAWGATRFMRSEGSSVMGASAGRRRQVAAPEKWAAHGGQGARPTAAILAAVLLASCASPLASGGAGGASPAVGQSAGASATASALVSPEPSSPVASSSAAVSASGPVMQVTVPLGGTHSVVVTVEDRSGALVGARPATLQPDQQVPARYGDDDIAAWNPGGKPSAEVWLYWGGVVCDTTTAIVIDPGARAITVTEGPRPACDLANVGRGLVLTFATAVDAGRILATFTPAKPTR